MPALDPLPVLAHALPPSVGAVPLTLILTVLLGAFLAANAVATRRAAVLVAAGDGPLQHGGTRGDGRIAGGFADGADRAAGTVVGLLLLIATLLLTLFGTPDPANNITDVVVLQFGFGAIAITSMLLGPWWRAVNPVNAASRGLMRMAGGAGDSPLSPRAQLIITAVLLMGWAAAQLLAVWTPTSFAILLLLWITGHALISGSVGASWLDVEPTNAVTDVLGLLRPGGGGPLARLSTIASTSRVIWVSAILIAWSLTDLLLATEWWHDLALPSDTAFWVGLEGLVLFSLALGGLVRAVSRRVGLGPAFVPVAGGWVVAHYLSLLVIDGQGIAIWLSDPFNTGADLFGLAGQYVNPEPIPIALLSALQMVPFLLGHLGGVVVAQRRATARVNAAAQIGPATVEARAVIAVLLLGGTWLQLVGL